METHFAFAQQDQAAYQEGSFNNTELGENASNLFGHDGHLSDYVSAEIREDGQVGLTIPTKYFWHCVECFAENRLSAEFSFEATHFVARVATTSLERVRKVLHDWTIPATVSKRQHAQQEIMAVA